MKSVAVWVSEPGEVVLRELELRRPDRGEVVIEADYSTLSPGTERHIILGAEFRPPVALGYSLAGHIAAVGSDVTRFKIGDAVVASAPHASHVIVDERAVVAAPSDVDLEQGAFFNLAHTALYGIRQSGLRLGEAVAVLGQGIVGLLAARLAQLAGAVPVIALDLDENRLALSRQLGIHEVINAKDTDRLRKLLDNLPGGGAPVVIEVTGARAPLEQALDIVSVRGRIVMLGMTHGDKTVQFHRPLSMKGAALIGAYVNSKPWSLLQTDMEIKEWPPALAEGSRSYSGPGIFTSVDDIRAILDLLKYKTLDLRPLITDRITPAQVPSTYRRVLDKDPSLVGAVIHWRQSPRA